MAPGQCTRTSEVVRARGPCGSRSKINLMVYHFFLSMVLRSRGAPLLSILFLFPDFNLLVQFVFEFVLQTYSIIPQYSTHQMMSQHSPFLHVRL